MRITTPGRAAPVAFAATELAAYLARLTGIAPAVPASAEPPARAAAGLRLGTFADFGADLQPWPAVRRPEWDDAVFIETDGAAGIIAGSNPRSVLLAAYRFLAELGCRWVRPGPDGEYFPLVDLAARAVRVIEGACSYEHVRALVDWAPKVGLNAYFIQFREAYTFFERWHNHRLNPLLAPEPFSVRAGARPAGPAGRGDRLEGPRLSRRRPRLDLRAAGHPRPRLGVPGAERYLAEVGGRRALWGGIPLNTQLCYSTPEVRVLMVEDIVAYARAHPEVDVLHVWLADGWNNHCECAGCRQARPADWYVCLLNELDARLTAAGAALRIAFLIYMDLLWPPETARLRNPDRFILMFAPISRIYSRAFTGAEPVPGATLPPYERNRLRLLRSVESNVAFLRAWQGLLRGDSFDFDYHLMWDHYADPGRVAVAEVLHRDIPELARLDLDGLVSCQVQRAFFPTGLAMVVLGRALWSRAPDFPAIAEDFFRTAFGADGPACLAYCAELSRLFDPPYLRGEKPRGDPPVAASYARLPATIAAFRPTIRRNLGAADPCHARSWHYLDAHADVCELLAGALRHRVAGDDEAALRAWAATQRFVQEREPDLHPVFDVYESLFVLDRFFTRGSFRPTAT